MSRITVELAHFLQSEVLGLVDHEVDEGYSDPAESTPDPEDVGSEVGVLRASQIWCDESQQPVEEPIRGGGQREALRTCAQREHLARHNPSARSESRGEEKDINADEGELSNDRGVVIDARRRTACCHNVLRDTHTQSACQENRSPAEPIDSPKSREGRYHVYHIGDDGQDERLWKCIGVPHGEVCGAVVEDEVDPNQLLERLKGDTCEDTLAHRSSKEFQEGRSAQRLFVFVVASHLIVLSDQIGIFDRETSEEAY